METITEKIPEASFMPKILGWWGCGTWDFSDSPDINVSRQSFSQGESKGGRNWNYLLDMELGDLEEGRNWNY